MVNISPKFHLLLPLVFLLSSCGGGGSSSGGSAPPQPMASSIPAGVYSGTEITTFSGPEIINTTVEGMLQLTVTGSFVGQQQVVIAFRQFSGSSSIVPPNNFFSINSGVFTINGQQLGLCQVDITFSGNFSGATVTGTTEGTWNCANLTTAFRESGTWTLTHGSAAKFPAQDRPQPSSLSY